MQKADELWLTPCGPRPDKPSLKTPAIQRWLMCHLAVDTTFGTRFPIRVCDEEVFEEKALNSYVLMQRLEAKYPDIDFMFACGADIIPGLRKWPPINAETGNSEMWDKIRLLGLPRPGYAPPVDRPDKFTWLSGEGMEGAQLVTAELSSSEVRSRIKNFGDDERQSLQDRNLWSVEGLLPASVISHIVRNDLYIPEDQEGRLAKRASSSWSGAGLGGGAGD